MIFLLLSNSSAQFLCAPKVSHTLDAQHILRYLNGTLHHGLFYFADSILQVHAYCDADSGTCIDSTRSLTCYYIFLGKSFFSWKTKKQKVVSKSSTKAKYRSMSLSTTELTLITNLLAYVKINVPTHVPLFFDNKAAQHIVENTCTLMFTIFKKMLNLVLLPRTMLTPKCS